MKCASVLSWFVLVAVSGGVPATLAADRRQSTANVVASPAAQLELAADVRHPMVACTAPELERLKAAYAGDGPAYEVVAAVIQSAERRIGRPVEFPPRGGQHNQWYQCGECQLGLKTIDATHHQCPRCHKVYTGEPYDDVVFASQHGRNLGAMRDAAWAYAITGDEKYAAFAREVLLGYAHRYRAYPYHDARLKTGAEASRSGGHLFEQTLNEASEVVGTIAPAYDLIHRSTTLAAADHELIRAQLIRPMLENLAKHKAGKSNWQTWHNAAMIWGGAVIGDATWVRRAIEDPENGFLHQMEVSVSDEGMWYENSWGYHFYTLSALVKTAEAARRLGVDLWSHPVLKKMFLLPIAYAMPDRSLPRFGDDSGTSLNQASRMLEYAYRAYGDPDMVSLLPRSLSWDSVMAARRTDEDPIAVLPGHSALFPSAGHAILRTGGDSNLVAALTFGPYGGSHGHFDKLSFVLFGFGRELGVDPGRARSQAYRLPIHQQWYKGTIGHNAVVIDQSSQKPATGRLESYGAARAWAAVVARCDDAYPEVAYRRVLCLTPAYLLVFDQLDANRPRRFDWLYHGRGAAAVCDAARQDEAAAAGYPGWNHVRNVRFGATDAPIRVGIQDGELTTHLTMAAASGSDVRVGDGVGGSVLERIPVAMVTRRGEHARFAAVLEPVRGDRRPAVSSIAVEPAGERVRIIVERAGTRDEFVLDVLGGLQVSSGGTTVLETDTHAADRQVP